jgi:hypothetical protein
MDIDPSPYLSTVYTAFAEREKRRWHGGFSSRQQAVSSDAWEPFTEAYWDGSLEPGRLHHKKKKKKTRIHTLIQPW